MNRLFPKIVTISFALILTSTLTFAAEKKGPPNSESQCKVGRGLVDINNATKDQLKALPGVNEAYCKKIIAGRPYTSMSHFASKQIIPKPAYDKIKDHIVIKPMK